MKLKERTTGSPEELAKFLLDISRRIIERKSVSVKGAEIKLPPVLDIKLKYKEKEGRAKVKISFAWDKDATRAGIAASGNDAVGSEKHKRLKVVATGLPPKKLKELKKDMEKTLFTIKRTLRDNEFPDAAAIDHFNRLVTAFKKRAKAKWLPSIQELEDAAAGLTQAVADHDQTAALSKIETIIDLKEKYHDIYK
ncbi:MAG TPA: hypothetical protein ENH19_03445 [Actinobacteria bacterium]|nr:hypothetical protein [Actinomycetes bacterium]HEX21688.1 hypothetical protein [Actinomycetota bacterium]